MNTSKPLLIYSASAGSGKTYTLVKTYLELILKGDTNPLNFAKIMAMTFTNKAALEMKTRIVDALADLSNPNRHRVEKKRINAQKYVTDISKDFNLTAEKTQQKAQLALMHILHQYEDFYVMTIDKFNLRLIRSFAMDLNLEANFKVIIDETEIKQRVVDDFLNEIDPQVSSLLSRLFIEIAENRIEDGSGWNFEKELFKYLSILDKEEALELLKSNKPSDNQASKLKEITTKIHYYRGKLNTLSATFFQDFTLVFETADIPKTYNKSLNSFLNKIKKNAEDIEKIMPDAFTAALIKYIEQDELPEPAQSILKNYYQQCIFYLSEIEKLLKIKSSTHYIRLLHKINDRLKDFRETEQIIRISEFNQMISDLLKGENTDYIYEKLGVRYNHFLLDEFQDTSHLQWKNIIPLLHESISQGYKNLIVGDPKQSIYRFRGGVAEQFVALPGVYNPKNDSELAQISNFFKRMGEKKELEDNYRSAKDVVLFNNLFFENFVQFIRTEAEIPNDFSNYYDKIRQNVKNDKPGFIEIHSVYEKKEKQGAKEEEEEEDTSEILQFLLKSVQACLEDGYEKGDICILGDTAKLCNTYALALTEEGHDVVSSDSLAVNSENSVKLCITYLKWRNQISNELLAKQFAERFLSIKFPEKSTEIFASYNKEKPSSSDSEKQIRYFDYKAFIHDFLGDWNLFIAPFENLYALLEHFYSIAALKELQNPYIHHLSDLAFNFDLNFGPDIPTFLNYYEKTGSKSSIQTPENKNSIKIMTSHKSKGLEFKVVIIPQLDKCFLRGDNQYLVSLNEELAYTKISLKVVSKELQQKYNEEYKAALLDKLNLCYVGFTRAVDRLYVMSFFSSARKTNFASAFFHPFMQKFAAANNADVLEDKNESRYHLQFGKREKLEEKVEEVEEKEDATFKPANISDKLWFPSISLKKQLDDLDTDLEENLRYGRQLHLLLSEIENFQTTDAILTAYIQKGLVEHAFQSRLHSDLQNIMQNKTYKELHHNKLQIINEQAIILSANEIKRPDKIIVKDKETIVLDFKTGLKTSKNDQQVKKYCAILSQMGFPNVKGVLLYTQNLEFIWV